jgi:hypothetical protein
MILLMMKIVDQSHHTHTLIDEKTVLYVVKNAKIFVILIFFAEFFNFFKKNVAN